MLILPDLPLDDADRVETFWLRGTQWLVWLHHGAKECVAIALLEGWR